MARITSPAVILALAVAAVPAAMADTLSEIYELALKNDAGIRAAEATYRAGQENVNLARAGLLPQIYGNASYQTSSEETEGQYPVGSTSFPNETDTDVDTSYWGATLSQPLFDAPAWFGFERGKQLTRQAELTFSAEQQDLIVRVAEAYFLVLRAIDNLNASRAQEEANKRQLDQTQQRFDVGLIAITDVHEARASYDLAVANRLADEGNLGVSLEALSVLTGQKHANLWLLKDDYPVQNPEPMSMDDWVQFALDNNLNIKVAETAREAALAYAKAARAEHYPKVAANLSYDDARSDIDRTDNITDINSRFDNDRKGTTASIDFTLPLYTGGYTSAARRQAWEQYNTSVEQYSGAVRNTTQLTRALHLSVVTDVARTHARQQAITSSRSALDATQAGYEVGTRNIVDVLTVQEALYSAIRDYANVRYDYVINTLRLKRAAGTLSPQDIYDLNTWLESPPAPTASTQPGT